jgi:hypothetical protein
MTLAELQEQFTAASAADTALSREELEAREAAHRILEQRLRAAEVATRTLAALAADTDDERWYAFLVDTHAALTAERAALVVRDTTTREHAERLLQSLRITERGLAGTLGVALDLTSLPLGARMLAAGYEVKAPLLDSPAGFRGALPVIEQRLAQRDAEIRAAQAVLHDALLSDDERAARAEQAALRRAAFNGLNARISAEGDTLVAFRDGQVLPVEHMTELERDVFAEANGKYQAEQQARFARSV